MTRTDVAGRAAAAFRPSERVRIGAEVEWLVFGRADPRHPVPAPVSKVAAEGPLPAGGTVTVEPGGQLELVTLPAPDAAALIALIDTDTRVLVSRLAIHGLVLVPLGLDPIRPAKRTLDVSRYEAMERYFAERTPAGVDMMCRTASVQLNIDFGPRPEATWGLAHQLAPLLSATFANSPTEDGSEFKPISHRQRVWAATDPSRTRPVGGPPADWYEYVLDARVMLRSDGASAVVPELEPLTFAEWIERAEPPTSAELDLHLSTLFPPVRPRGYLELRMIDALPPVGRAAAIATVWTLFTDAASAAEAESLCATIAEPWDSATSEGLGDPELRRAATDLLALVRDHLRPTHPALADACERWRARVDSAAVAATIDELLLGENDLGIRG